MTLKNAAVLILALALAGCSGLKSSAPPPRRSMLFMRPPLTRRLQPRRIIAVAEPSVPPGF